MTDRSQRKLSAILAADVAGYGRLVDHDEERAVGALREHLDAVLPIIADYGGRVIDTAGDGILAEFPSAVRATEAAIAIQRRAEDLDADVPAGERMRFRIGINVGDVMVEDGKLFGDGVNVAARLEQLAEPGSVLISGTAFDNLQGKIDVPLDFAGEQHVKNISRPIRAYRVRMGKVGPSWHRWAMRGRARWREGTAGLMTVALLLGVGWWLQPGEPALAQPSIAVLPFSNLEGDAATGRLADGLTEDIITDLSHVADLKVIARNSTEVYKGTAVDVRKVGHDLDVAYVMEGSLQRDGDQIRVTAQLIDVANGAHVWSQRWDRPAGDVFAIQTEIADHIVGQFEMTNGPVKSANLLAARRKRPTSLTAYELNLLGVEKQLSPTRESIDESIAILNKAIAADPTYARAWINLAWANMVSANYGADPTAANKAALAAAERAVSLDFNDAEAHAVLASVVGNLNDLGRAKSEFDIALRLNPGSFAILTYYISFAPDFGEIERGAQLADQAIQRNPNYKPWASGTFRFVYFMAHRCADALHVMERQTPDNYTQWAWVQRAGCLAELGRTDEAKATVQEALKRYPTLSIEESVNRVGPDDAIRQRHLEAMRLAGFPACAKPDQLNGFTNPFRLPECAVQAKP
ncbi:adenylate cyclase [Labrys miyagiensis]|uniref:Adenylate cyclase n=1 Tax=Labrys miyagiensis TaxID=346912 RepID=A0ABQ6CR03_9HYPH|nr:adenylate/guanylate cyclase domain-containing protein [Labrys miyagiensis]GLS20682.1 adenylate cyclase [Labrys miyagiensis]